MKSLAEGAVLLATALLFTFFCTAPLKSLQGNASLRADFGVAADQDPPPTWLLPFDDSYIFIRYAQQAHRGQPMQWNSGEASSGASSFLYPWLLLPGQWWADDLAGWSKWSRSFGLLTLWALGLTSALFMRRIGLPTPWPLAAGVAVIWSGPVGLGALAGMESALNAAALVLALALWTRLSRSGELKGGLPLAILVSLLPLLRPENLLLTGLAALAVLLLPRAPLPKWTAPLLVLPGLSLTLLNLALTGLAQPTAVVTKSWLGIAFPDLGTLLKLYGLGAATEVLPVYLGREGFLLWPPVGVLALATALISVFYRPPDSTRARQTRPGGRPAVHDLRPLALAWLVLVVLAPMSSMPSWQAMRHHHSGLVCAWLLAFAGAGLLVDRASVRLGPAARFLSLLLLVPLALLSTVLPLWGRFYTASVVEIHHRHGPAVAWLDRHQHDSVLLLNDAGLLSLAHDGPAIDLMGLGTPELAKPYRHGAGAMLEALARRQTLPTLAAANLDVFRLGALLGRPLIEGLDPRTQTLLAEVDRALLATTVLSGDGIDFGDLGSEARAGLTWKPPPDPYQPSFALKRAAPTGEISLQGCRPLKRRLEIGLTSLTGTLRIVATSLADRPAVLTVGFGGADRQDYRPQDLRLSKEEWSDNLIAIPEGADRLWLAADPGSGPPCLESISRL